MTSRYDAFPYRALPIPEAHVDRLWLIAHLFRADPAPLDGCRVLELGCADGGHLVPMAERFPGAEFVGVDLSERQIRDGKSWIKPVQLDNLRLQFGDALEMDDALGTFDYILCHGLYSWIPAPARRRLLQVIGARLRPHGVAYVSYNVFPGWHTRREVRDFILQHAAETEDPHERAAGARTMLQFLHEASDPDSDHGRLVRAECEALLGTSPQYLIHGLLGEVNEPCYLLDFVGRAAQAGLDYLGDAHLSRMIGTDLHEAGRRRMAEVPGGATDHEQVLDYLQHRRFRQSLLVPAGTPIERTIPWTRVAETWVSGKCVRRPSSDGTEGVRFDSHGGEVVTSDPVWEAGLDALGKAWPASLAFRSWAVQVQEAVGGSLDDVAATLGRQVMPMFARGVLQLWGHDRRVAGSVQGAPRSTRWARRQVELGHSVTDLAHQARSLNDDLGQLLTACDGTTPLADLVARFQDTRPEGPTWVVGALESLRIRSLLLESP